MNDVWNSCNKMYGGDIYAVAMPHDTLVLYPYLVFYTKYRKFTRDFFFQVDEFT